MSNVKRVYGQWRLPYNWQQSTLRTKGGRVIERGMSESDLATLGSLFLSPVTGVRLSQRSDGYDDNKDGGRTGMYVVVVEGEEALAWPFLSRIRRIFDRAVKRAQEDGVQARVEYPFSAEDIEVGGPPAMSEVPA